MSSASVMEGGIQMDGGSPPPLAPPHRTGVAGNRSVRKDLREKGNWEFQRLILKGGNDLSGGHMV